MNAMGLKQKAVAAILGMVALYLIAVVTWFVSAESAWKKAAKNYDRAVVKYRNELKLIGESAHWDAEYEAERAAMPTFAAGKATDTTWMQRMDDVAARHHLLISQRQPGAEVAADDVMELPIDVKSWEGSLEALVRFLHELENGDDGMFAVTQLNIRPSSKKGYLRGSFTLNCAYMRED